jgi:hypothetical protein
MCRFFCRLFTYVLPLEIQLTRGEGWDPNNRSNLAISLCLSQAILCSVSSVRMIVRFVYIGGIDDHDCLNILFLSHVRLRIRSDNGTVLDLILALCVWFLLICPLKYFKLYGL